MLSVRRSTENCCLYSAESEGRLCNGYRVQENRLYIVILRVVNPRPRTKLLMDFDFDLLVCHFSGFFFNGVQHPKMFIRPSLWGETKKTHQVVYYYSG